MVDVKKLLKRKKLNGRELGILEITNMATLFKQGKDGMPQEPIVDSAWFREQVHSLYDEQERATYDGYLAIYDWLEIYINTAKGQTLAALYSGQMILTMLNNAEFAENVLSFTGELPKMLSEGNDAAIEKSQKLSEAFEPFSLRRYFKSKKDCEWKASFVLSSWDVLKRCYYFGLAYNWALDVTAEEFDIPAISVFKQNTELIDDLIDDINEEIADLESLMSKSKGKSASKKLEILHTIFPKCDYKSIAIPEEQMKAAKEQIASFVAFQDHNLLLDFFAYRENNQ